MQRKLIMIEWHDASGVTSPWQKEITVAPCTSIGFLVRKNKKEIVIAHTQAADGDFGGLFAIPRGFVKIVDVVSVPKGKK